mgnify:CR=1 FL=1
MTEETLKTPFKLGLTKIIGRRIVATVILIVVCYIASSVFINAVQLIKDLQNGDIINWPSLFSFSLTLEDGLIPGIIFMLIGFECVYIGWQNSALRRILTDDDAGTRTDIFYFVIAVTGVQAVLIKIATLGLGVWTHSLLENGAGFQLAIDLPLWLACPLIFMLQSFCIYWSHRFVHTPLMWPLHAVHHHAKNFNVITAARHHPVDAFFGEIAGMFIPAMIGFPAEAVLIVGLFVTLYAIYVHSHLPMPSWFGRYVIHGPRGHGIHHSCEQQHHNSNFGDLVIWDRLFGTYNADAPEVINYGCDDPHGHYASGKPLRDMLSVQAHWFKGLYSAFKMIGTLSQTRNQNRIDPPQKTADSAM